MKLEDWWFNNSAKDANDLTNKERAKGKHVIGTCKDCKHWDDQAASLQDCTLDNWGECNSISTNVETSGPTFQTDENYGCIHWEPEK